MGLPRLQAAARPRDDRDPRADPAPRGGAPASPGGGGRGAGARGGAGPRHREGHAGGGEAPHGLLRSGLMASAPIERIIKAAVERGASDLHVKAGDLFRARIDGKLVPLTKQRLTPEQTRTIALKLMSTEQDRSRIETIKDYDCSWGMPGVGRFRVNILRQRSSFMIVMRAIPFHIVTIENPIEFLHRDLSSSMTQREVGVDTEDFDTGLRAALRQDPDVIVVGDIRDQSTIDTAMKAVETGHLLISALPTPDVMTSIGQVLSMLPREERDIGRVRFSEAAWKA